jgi:hypothetical protein
VGEVHLAVQACGCHVISLLKQGSCLSKVDSVALGRAAAGVGGWGWGGVGGGGGCRGAAGGMEQQRGSGVLTLEHSVCAGQRGLKWREGRDGQ